ncbi:hypothetical protein I4U30_24395 [Enterobacter asburiae]|uniref:hypothetical protein n=1 Tax=Enterobacter asburiae TaxID=61645 RepID=UPI00192C61F4|nr:hypothetical protein [Enterobacter asburiae]MBL5841397.1 hypothetical protein [Enterobacter asburiae]
MKVKGTHTTVQTVDVELSDSAVKSVVYGQTIDYLADAVQEKLLYKFLHSLPPEFDGKRTIRESYRSGNKGKLALVHVDADWNYHNNVGEDEEVRVLTEDERSRYKVLCNISKVIKDLQK